MRQGVSDCGAARRGNAHAAEETPEAELARLLEREQEIELDESRLAQLERVVEGGDVTVADGDDERCEDVREDGKSVHELVRWEVPAQHAEGDEVREDAPVRG